MFSNRCQSYRHLYFSLGIALYAILGGGSYSNIPGNSEPPKAPGKISFSGRISQTDKKRWLNDRLVLVYAQDNAAGRNESQIGSLGTIIRTATDGVFTVTVQNTYSIRRENLKGCIFVDPDPDIASCWLGELIEDSPGVDFSIPEKRLQYAVRIIPGDYDALPEEMKEQWSTSLSEGSIILSPSKPPPPNGTFEQALAWWKSKPKKINTDAPADLVKSVQNDPHLEVVEVPSQSATATLDNCNGSESAHQTYVDSKTFVREYQVQAGIGVGIPIEALEIQLGAQGGFRSKQILTKTIKYEIAAKPGTNVSYKIHWREIWQKGMALVQGKKGLVRLPFRVRKDVEYALESSAHACGLP
jgi:hypothetical protein